MTYHLLEPMLFDKLARGGGGAAAVGVLRSAQLSKHLLLVRYLLERWPGTASERDNISDALDRAQARCPERFGEVLGAPLVGAWAAATARAKLRGHASRADFGHLAAVAVVACAAAGVDGASTVPVRDSLVAVPGLGAAVVPAVEVARLVASGGQLVVSAGTARVELPANPTADCPPGWQPVRFLASATAAQRIALSLDDLDPYRHGHHAPPAPRLSPAAIGQWQALFTDAWELLAEQLPERASELAAGLHTLVPLVQTDEHSARSATIRHAFGVFGLTRPPSAADFAVTLVHEFQHSKLSAMLDLMPLIDPADTRRYFAPWRVDPRPLIGLLQGVYAFVGVADTWRALREVQSVALAAETHFAEARLQVDRGLATLEQCGALTEAGWAMTTQLRRTVDAMLAESVCPSAVRAAEGSLERTWQQWAARNAPVS